MMNEFTEKLKNLLTGRIVVYIDAANLERSVKDMFVRADDIPDNLKHHSTDVLRWSIDYKKLNDFLKTLSDFRGVRFYTAEFPGEAHHKFRYFLAKGLKFKLVTKPLKEYGDHTKELPHRKANFDVEIAVDSTYSINDFDTFILFSGDCDFEYLIKFLRGIGKVVIGFSRSGHIAKELPPAFSHYFDVGNFRNEIMCVKEKSIKAKSSEPLGPEPRS